MQTMQAVAVNYGCFSLPIWDTEGSWGMQSGLPDHSLQANLLACNYRAPRKIAPTGDR
jgi:hypothetical protein